MSQSQGTENKSTGSFYTPTWCVDILLSMSGYASLPARDILSTRIIDPSCGDGSILVRILESSIGKLACANVDKEDIEKWVRENVYGFELDGDEAAKCAANMEKICRENGLEIPASDIHVIEGDALALYRGYIGSFDYVIGNPPYVRIHNMEEKPDSAYITGMCDLYYAFYDIGQKLLRDGGRLCFISPSSWMTSKSGEAMRRDLECRGVITDVLDFAHYQVFGNAATYTAIIAIGKESADKIRIWSFDEEKRAACRGEEQDAEAFWCSGNFYSRDISGVREILADEEESEGKSGNGSEGGNGNKDSAGRDDAAVNDVKVRNGYATLCDKAYLVDGDDMDIARDGVAGSAAEENEAASCGYVIDVVKASRGTTHKIIYPDDDEGRLMDIEEIEKSAPRTYERLVEWRDKLLARNKVDASKWWGFGRSQGIADTYRDKVAVQSIVRPGKKIVVADAPAGVGVYGGIYVIGMGEEEVVSALADEKFVEYVTALAKYKSGGYYTFSGKELERYLRWWKRRE